MDRFQEMRVFAAVVDAGSFTGATEALDMSKPAVSRHVADLESRLGVRLLHRTTRKLSLTDAGAAYLATCKNILEQVGDAERGRLQGGQQGDLQWNFPPAAGQEKYDAGDANQRPDCLGQPEIHFPAGHVLECSRRDQRPEAGDQVESSLSSGDKAKKPGMLRPWPVRRQIVSTGGVVAIMPSRRWRGMSHDLRGQRPGRAPPWKRGSEPAHAAARPGPAADRGFPPRPGANK